MKNTKTVPNQRIIYIERIRTNSTDGYLQVSTLSVLEAMYNLKGNAFKLWIYFVNNRDRYIKLEGQTHNMWSFKSIIRKTDLINHIGLHFANFEDSEYINYCLSDGNNASEKLLICCDNINDDEQFKRAEECNDYIENGIERSLHNHRSMHSK